MLNHQKLKCYEYSLLLAKRVPDLVAGWPTGSGYLVDQLRRAISSVTLNIAEGNGRTSFAERKRFFCIARGSAMEVSAIIDVAEALKMISKSEYDLFQSYLLQIVKILYKLK